MHQVVGSDNYIGGLIDMGSGHVHPLNLVVGEASAALAMGVKIFENSKVTDIQYGATHRVTTEQGSIECDTLVICGNAYVAGLNPKLEGQVLPAVSYIIATEQLTDEQCQRILPQNMAVCDQRVALDYYRLSADNRLLFGGLCNYSGRDPKSIVATLKPHMDLVFPELNNTKIDYQWGGMIGIGANRMPQIGKLQENVYFAQAYSGHGVNATHMAAKVIAEHIHKESDRLKHFETIRHMQFPGGRLFRSPMLAAGMLYHRAKDIF
jgi:glycine/D-amino acid oxidase-like deaminating enzyme